MVPAVVTHCGAHHRHPLAPRALADHAAHGAAHGGLLAHAQLGDAFAIAIVLVAARIVSDEVGHGREAEARRDGAPWRVVTPLISATGRANTAGSNGESCGLRPFLEPTAGEGYRKPLSLTPRHAVRVGSDRCACPLRCPPGPS